MFLITSIIFTIITAYIIYKLFERYGYKGGLIFTIICEISMHIIQGNFKDYSVNHILIIIGMIIILEAVAVGIKYFVYNRTNSFIAYFLVSFVLDFLFVIILASLLTLIRNF